MLPLSNHIGSEPRFILMSFNDHVMSYESVYSFKYEQHYVSIVSYRFFSVKSL